jgi:hypothetical protein
MVTISDEQRRWRLARRHFLAMPASSVEQIAGGLAGLHSSDPITVYLSCRARMESFTQDDLDTALYQERALIRLHGMRRTLFVVPLDLAGVMTSGCTNTYVEPQRKRLVGFLEAGGITDDGEAWLHDVESDTLEALEQLGESTATELREAVPALRLKIPFGQGKKWGGQVGVSTRVLFLLATAGHIVRTRPLVSRGLEPAGSNEGPCRSRHSVAQGLRTRHPRRHQVVDRMGSGRDPTDALGLRSRCRRPGRRARVRDARRRRRCCRTR